MSEVDQRTALARLVEESGADYAGLSRMLGRNPAYVQQFIKRGVPRKLDEQDRRLLARYFGVDESVLGGPAASGARRELVSVPRLDVSASAGAGAVPGFEMALSHLGFDERWLRQLCNGRPDELSMISVQGDSMHPTLADGDDILVRRFKPGDRLRDGVYVLRRDDSLMVKRLSINPASGTISVTSDNGAYPSWPECDPRSIHVIGRVIWVGRRLA